MKRPFGDQRHNRLEGRYWPTVHPVDCPSGLTPTAAWHKLLAGEITYDEWAEVLKAWQ